MHFMNRSGTTLLGGIALAMAGGPLLAADGTGTVSRQDCGRITVHTPAPGVEYKPGEDVQGRKVAPADLGGGSAIVLPNEIVIDIGIKLDEKYGLGAGGVYAGAASVGKVAVRDGALYWNDRRMDAADQHAIAEACRKAYGNRR